MSSVFAPAASVCEAKRQGLRRAQASYFGMRPGIVQTRKFLNEAWRLAAAFLSFGSKFRSSRVNILSSAFFDIYSSPLTGEGNPKENLSADRQVFQTRVRYVDN